MTGIAALKRYFSQFSRFAMVGVGNSIVDIGMTNLLVYTFSAESAPALFVISLVACFIATINSYFFNRIWTFRASTVKPDRTAIIRFFFIAFLAILINTSVFLFLYSYLDRHFVVSKWWSLNVAKVGGIICASVFSFLGYKLGVFDRSRIQTFKAQFQFGKLETGRERLWQWLAVFVGALALRWFYCAMKLEVEGLSLLCGVLLLAPVMLIARHLFGGSVAIVTGWLCAVHPRLVEFSCHGSVEMLYLIFGSFGTLLFMTFLPLKARSVVAWLGTLVLAVGLVAMILSQTSDLQALVDRAFDILRRLPGVLGTPIVLFAFLLPLVAHLPSKVDYSMLWPLWVMLLFPVFYCLVFACEPRFMLPMIIPIQIFGAAGLVAFCAYVSQRLGWPFLYQVAVGMILIFSLVVILMRGL